MHNSNNNRSFSEQELMNDILTTEKQVISSYSTGITESSCSNLRNTLISNFRNAQDVQFRVFSAMEQKGWYKTEDAPSNKVQEAKQKANQMSTELK